MDRRSFLTHSAALTALPLLSRGAAASWLGLPDKHLTRIGLELYSVRNEMKRDPEATLAAIRSIGYNDVELLWTWKNFDRSTMQVKATLERLGLRAPSAHIDPGLLLGDWTRSVATANTLGHDYLIVPSLPDEQRLTIDKWKRWADRFNVAGAVARKTGVWLAFHNEPPHMQPVGGVVPYDAFVDHTDPKAVRLQLDVGNMRMGGGDPFEYLSRYRDRYWSFHLKDTTADGSADTELGRGTFDFRRFLSEVPDLQRKPCYVEQENPADALASARLDFEYLRQLRF